MNGPEPVHWLGVADAAGVLLALVLWLLLVDERWGPVRDAVRACGTALLLLAVGRALDRLTTLGFALGSPGFLSDAESGRHWTDLALCAAGVAAGLFLATWDTSADAAAPAEEPVVQEQVEAPEPVSIPDRAWSRTEVIGDEPEPAGALRLALPLPDTYAARFSSATRGVASPLLAVAAGLGLPLFATAQFTFFSRFFFAGRSETNALQVTAHVLSGLMLGAAVAGVAFALDVWERRLAVAAFALAALGALLYGGWPTTFENEYWIFVATGLAAGLTAPATLRVVRRAAFMPRRALVAGVAVALGLVVTTTALHTRAVSREPEAQFVEDGG
jgi:hypothetical protein